MHGGKKACFTHLARSCALGSWYVKKIPSLRDAMLLRSYACPSCGLLIQTELARPTRPPLRDIQLAL